jgi:hypothetical protein
MPTRISTPTEQNTDEMQPYSPSFLDRFMRFIQRLPTPYWLTYLLLFILQSVINHVLAWMDGWLPAFTFHGTMLLFPLWQWGTLAAVTYLNMTSDATLSSFSPLLDSDDDALKKIKYEFTTMPTRGVILSGVTWILAYLLLNYLTYDAFYVGYGLGNSLRMFIFLEGLIGYSTGSVIYYHSIRQLWLVNGTVKMVKQFNLFHLDPVHAFSRLTSRTGISWMFLLGLTLLLFPLDLARGPILALLGFQVVLALAAFVLPLRFVNYHLVSEKRRLLAELNQQIGWTVERLHHSLDQNEVDEAAQLGNALMGLNTEREILMDISTWPWRTGTMTAFLSAIVLPIVLLLLQIVIQKWLGG